MLRALLTKIFMKPRQDPVIFVTGCTGTGKSDLGIAIARKYGGEVISADSMQIYKGLDIVTNKVTAEEMSGIPHHLMSFLDAGCSGYNVQEFQRQSLQKIQEIKSRGKIPVLVGGTAYYIESVLFEDNMIQTEGRHDLSVHEELSNEELYEQLKEVDPASAALVHPNNRARVLRALHIYRLTGKAKSELVREQHERNGAQGRPRFDNTLVITMDASKEVLDQRLDDRVGKMVALGLKKELDDYFLENEEKLEAITHGVLQCIGPKEFLPYLRAKDSWNTPDGEKLFDQGCQDLQLHTRQYARKQRRWVKSRFYGRDLGDEVTVNTVDSSVKETFIEDGLEVVDRWMRGGSLGKGASETSFTHGPLDGNLVFHCQDCERTISGKTCWEEHLKGRAHRKRVASNKRRAAC